MPLAILARRHILALTLVGPRRRPRLHLGPAQGRRAGLGGQRQLRAAHGR